MKDSNTAVQTLDLSRAAPHLTLAQKQRMQTLAAMPDDHIDYSDAPALPTHDWVKVVSVPCAKQQISLRIDSDVLDYFRGAGSRYQTRINAVLRTYVDAHKAQSN